MSAMVRPGFEIDFQAVRARTLLDQKVRETIAKCGVAGLAAVLVSEDGDRTIVSAQGKRKHGASGDQNHIAL